MSDDSWPALIVAVGAVACCVLIALLFSSALHARRVVECPSGTRPAVRAVPGGYETWCKRTEAPDAN